MANNYKAMYFTQNEMRKHYEDLFKTGVQELQFQRIECDMLLCSLAEIESMTNDKLAKSLCKMAKERYNMDVSIHSRLLFNEDETL